MSRDRLAVHFGGCSVRPFPLTSTLTVAHNSPAGITSHSMCRHWSKASRLRVLAPRLVIIIFIFFLQSDCKILKKSPSPHEETDVTSKESDPFPDLTFLIFLRFLPSTPLHSASRTRP